MVVVVVAGRVVVDAGRVVGVMRRTVVTVVAFGLNGTAVIGGMAVSNTGGVNGTVVGTVATVWDTVIGLVGGNVVVVVVVVVVGRPEPTGGTVSASALSPLAGPRTATAANTTAAAAATAAAATGPGWRRTSLVIPAPDMPER